MDEKTAFLIKLGADTVEHIDGDLLAHLQGTKHLLEKWGASEALQDAGLFHACYGTAGFSTALATESNRHKLSAVIGEQAEEIVYLYCACEREDYFSKIGREKNPRFNDRFSGESYFLSNDQLRDFCELTAANELEISIGSPKFLEQYRDELYEITARMQPYLSPEARLKTRTIFGEAPR